MTAPVVVILGPSLAAISGVSTHLGLLHQSSLANEFHFCHFQIGSEGHHESPMRRLLRLFISPFSLAACLLREGADLVHINTSLNHGAFWRDLVYMVVARLCFVRVVYQVHGGALPQEFCGNTRLGAALLQSALSLPDVIVVLAQCELAAYLDFVPNQSVRVIANAIDLTPFAAGKLADSISPSVTISTDDKPLRLLYLGRLTRDKGLFEAIHALKIARDASVNTTLVLAGSGPQEEELRRLVKELQLESACTFAGPTFGYDKITLLHNADVLMLPTYAEGLPYALLEGMAAGLPVICTQVGAIPDVVIDGVHGLFVPRKSAAPIADAIARLAASPVLRDEMSAACCRRITRAYSLTRLAADFGLLYRSLVTGRRSTPLRRRVDQIK